MTRQMSFSLHPLLSPRQARQLRHWRKELSVRTASYARMARISSDTRPIQVGRLGNTFTGKRINEYLPPEYQLAITDLVSKVADPEERALVERACFLAWEGHYGQERKDRSPYFTHPIAVARVLVEWGVSAEIIAAALCHDLIEDGRMNNGDRVTRRVLAQHLGERVARLVAGVTEFGKEPEFKGEKPSIAAIFRKLFEYGDRDMAILIIKLADRLHNMRTLEYTSAETQQKKARETLNVYARIADIMGMWELKRELEDWSFRYLEPSNYYLIDEIRNRVIEQSQDRIDEIAGDVQKDFAAAGLKAKVAVERRFRYEIYQRMERRSKKFEELSPSDIWRVNIVLPEVADCYVALGRVHRFFDEPVQGEMRDYIADPLPNGHRFLHTYVVAAALPGQLLVQIRDQGMFDFYRRGILSQTGEKGELQKQQHTWLTAARDHLAQEGLSTEETYEIIHAISSPIRVFTPKGEERALPFGSTVLDFARAIHEDIFFEANAADVNGRRVGIFHELKNGDRVEVIRDPRVIPSLEWLEHIRSGNAQKSLRAFLSIQDTKDIFTGALRALDRGLKKYFLPATELIETELFRRFVKTRGFSDPQAFLLEIGKGQRKVSGVVKRLHAYYLAQFNKAAKQFTGASPYYLSIEVDNKPGKLKTLVLELYAQRYNIYDFFPADSGKPGKAVIVFAVDLMPSRGLAGTLRRIQTIQLRSIAASIGEASAPTPKQLEELKEKKRK